MPKVKPRKEIGNQIETGALVDADRLSMLQGYLKTFFNATEFARYKWMRDYDMTEGNGKQWLNADRQKVQATGRPALEPRLWGTT
jgi:hypothetical protein